MKAILSPNVAKVASATIAAIGALGQSIILWHDLSECYPYKMMSYPPGRFFSITGHLMFLTAVLCIFIVVPWLIKHAPFFSPALTTLMMPLLWLLVVASATYFIYGFKIPHGIRNFDNTTIVQVITSFASRAGILSVLGIACGAICGLVLRLSVGSHRN
jgi:hypothetical protein